MLESESCRREKSIVVGGHPTDGPEQKGLFDSVEEKARCLRNQLGRLSGARGAEKSKPSENCVLTTIFEGTTTGCCIPGGMRVQSAA